MQNKTAFCFVPIFLVFMQNLWHIFVWIVTDVEQCLELIQYENLTSMSDWADTIEVYSLIFGVY